MIFKKAFIQTDSLEYFIKVKKVLDSNDIKYTDRTKIGNGWVQFITLLFVGGRGSYGLNDEHVQHYFIFVEEKDLDKAKELIKII